MKKFLILSLLSGILYAGNVEDGVTALKSGDYESAMANFIYAANCGDTIAQQNLGVMYYSGLGVPENREQAAYWFNKAGSMKAQYAFNEHGAHCGCRR